MTNGRIVGIAAGLIKTANHIPQGLAELARSIRFGSFTLEKCDGNKEPVYYFDPVAHRSINAVGLKNFGLPHFLEHDHKKILYIREAGCELCVSLAPRKQGDLDEMLGLIQKHGPDAQYIDEVEVNAACPNHRTDDGRLHDVLAHDPVALKTLMAEGKGYPRRKAIKIAPDMKPEVLMKCVLWCMEYGYQTIVSGNTLLSDTPLDKHGKPRISKPKGGMAGAPLFERALRQVGELRSIIDSIGVDSQKPVVVGCGGIMWAENVRQYIAAGADGGAQVATYFYEFGIRGFRDLVAELA